MENGFGQAVSIWTNPITGTSPGTSNPYISGDVKNSNITVSGIGRGTSLTGLITNNVYNTNGWTTNSTIDLNGYFNFTITPTTGYRVSLSSFVYTGTGGSKPPASFAFRTDANANNFTSNIGAPTLNGTTINLTTSNLSATTSFRLYGWNSNSGSGREWSINDFTFNGSVLGSAVTSLTSFTYVYGSGPSTAKDFTVNAAGLTTASAVVTIAGSTNYEISTTSATTGFGANATLTATSGSVSGDTVWVRLKSGLPVNTYNETITIGGGGVTGIPISVAGSVTKAVLTVTAEDKTKVYGTANPALTFSYSGFMGSDNASFLTTQPTASTTAVTTSPGCT